MRPPYGYISNDAQLIQAERFEYKEGRAKGTEGYRIENGLLSFTVLLDRCLDIYDLRFGGKLVSYLSETGVVNPAYYEPSGNGWLRSFCGGFLTTCGLTQAGEPCTFDGAEQGLHGRISNIAAKNVSATYGRGRESFSFCLSGEVRQACHQGEDLLLRRSITAHYGKPSLIIEDEISNNGPERSPLMLLYHFNFGYPFLCENTQLLLPPCETRGFDEHSEAHKKEYNDFGGSAFGSELTLVHKLKDSGQTGFSITDDDITVDFSYDSAELPYIAQWKRLHEKSYVMGIEPCNNHINGAAWERENGTLRYLLPGESIVNRFEIGFSRKG